MQIENIKEMQERHEKEIKELQHNCPHESISECMPFMRAPGHFSHCVKVCNFCGKEMFTTFEGNLFFDENGKKTLINKTCKEKLFTCPKRKSCFYWSRK